MLGLQVALEEPVFVTPTVRAVALPAVSRTGKSSERKTREESTVKPPP